MAGAVLALEVVKALDALVVVAPIFARGQVLAGRQMAQHVLVVRKGSHASIKRALELLAGADEAIGVALDSSPGDEAEVRAFILRGLKGGA